MSSHTKHSVESELGAEESLMGLEPTIGIIYSKIKSIVGRGEKKPCMDVSRGL